MINNDMRKILLVLWLLLLISCSRSSVDNNRMDSNMELYSNNTSCCGDSSIYRMMNFIPITEIQKAKAFCGKISSEPRSYGIEADTGFVVEYLFIKDDKGKIEFEGKAKKYFSMGKDWSDYPSFSYDNLFDFCVFDHYQTDSLAIGNSRESIGVKGLTSYSPNVFFHIDSTSTFLLLYVDSTDIIRSYRIGHYKKEWLSIHFMEIVQHFEKEAFTHLNRNTIKYGDYRRIVGSNRITMADIWTAQDTFVKKNADFFPKSTYTSGSVNKGKEWSKISPWRFYSGYYLNFSIMDSLYFVDVISRSRNWRLEPSATTQEVNEMRVDVKGFRIDMVPVMVGDNVRRIDSTMYKITEIGDIHYYYGDEITLKVKEKNGVVESYRYYYGLIDVGTFENGD